MKKLKGIRLNHAKNTQDYATEILPLPSFVKIPMSMSMGVACTPLVKVGDDVLVGQKIGDADAGFSLPVHSSVSGKVKAISDYLLVNGNHCKAVEIETDGKQTASPDIKPPDAPKNKDEFLKALRESGSCGMGGAGFPTHIKLNPKGDIDILIINAAECEPYITSDYRQMIENPQDVINGTIMIMQQLGIKKAQIAIESNKPKAIELLRGLCEKHPEIEVTALPKQYPQGAEKVIIYSCTGRIVGEGQLPSDQGVIVINVSTAAFIDTYFRTGMPLISKRITIDGDAVKKPCNVFVPIGTSVADALAYAQADTDKINKIIAGGPMMGMTLYSAEIPITKTSNALLAFEKAEAVKETACIRCARCVDACPLNLMPTALEKAYETRNVEQLKKLKVMLCMNCGCCTYVCPANRKLAESHQLAKTLIPRG